MGIKDLAGLIPDGNVGLAIKVLAAIVGVAWWTSAPGADEASDFKAKAEKRRGYTRHYALKGRGRKDSWLHSVKEERPELTPSRGMRSVGPDAIGTPGSQGDGDTSGLTADGMGHG